MLGLSRKTDYALLILSALARRGSAFVSLRALARDHRLSYRFAAEVVGLLTRAGLLESREGVRGGYRLARAAGDVSVAQVVHATEGGIALAGCLDPRTHGACPQKEWCTAKSGVGALQRMLLQSLATMTLADVVSAQTSDPR